MSDEKITIELTREELKHLDLVLNMEHVEELADMHPEIISTINALRFVTCNEKASAG